MTQSWNATYVQSGNRVTLTNMSYNPTIEPAHGVQSSVGFLGTYTGQQSGSDSLLRQWHAMLMKS